MKFKPLPLAALSFSLATSTAAVAAEAGNAQTTKADDATTMDTLVVTGLQSPYGGSDAASATGLTLSLRDTPQSVTVITRERLDDQNLQSLRDVLDNTTGVYSYAYDSERVVFTARGFTIDSLLYDGVPATTNYNTSSTDETIDTALFERIEIVRGATGLLTGAGSPAASINLVRKHANARSFEAEGALTYGSWDDRRAVADVSVPLTASGDVRARVVGVYQNRNSYQDFYENERKVFYGVIDADLGASTRLTLGADYQENNPNGNTWGSFPLFFSDGTRTDWRRSITTATKWSYWDKTKQSVFAELDHHFENGWVSRATLTRRTLKEQSDLFYAFGYPDKEDGTGLYPYEYRSDGDVKQTSLDAQIKGPFKLWGREHELVAGYNGSRVDVDGLYYNREVEALPDMGNFYEWDGNYPKPTHVDTTLVTDVKLRQDGLYTALRLQLADPLKLIAGARYNRYDLNYYDLYGNGEFTHEHTKLTPYAGLIYRLSPQWSAFTSYTSIFNPQNARSADGGYLDPIDGESVEAGIKGEHFGGRLNTALTLFDTRQNNVATPVFDDQGQAVYVPGAGLLQASEAVDGTKTRGFELEASGSPLPGWNLQLGWSRYLLEDAEGEAVKSYIPRTLIRAYTTYKLPGALNPLTLGGGVNWQSASTVNASAPSGLETIRQGSVPLLNLMARWEFTPALSLQLNGSNLLDRKYYVLDEYGNLYYGTPASASATLRYRF